MHYFNMHTIVVSLILSLFSFQSVADVVVIVNPASDISSLSRCDTKRIFLGKSKSYPNGKIAIPVEQIYGHAARDVFNEIILGKSDSELKRYWSRLIFSGEAYPPKALSDDTAVKNFVLHNASAIGYIDEMSLESGMNVVLTIR